MANYHATTWIIYWKLNLGQSWLNRNREYGRQWKNTNHRKLLQNNEPTKKMKTNEKHNKINKQRTQKTKINEQSGLSSKLDPLTTCTGRENPEAFQGEN